MSAPREGEPGSTYFNPHFPCLFLQSKGGILSKACDYIQELRQSNHRLSEELQGLDQLQLDNDVLRQQVRPLPKSMASELLWDTCLRCHLFPHHQWGSESGRGFGWASFSPHSLRGPLFHVRWKI